MFIIDSYIYDFQAVFRIASTSKRSQRRLRSESSHPSILSQALTKSGERKFTFGAQNENELVFVPSKNGKIDFLFTELYGAKRVHN